MSHIKLVPKIKTPRPKSEFRIRQEYLQKIDKIKLSQALYGNTGNLVQKVAINNKPNVDFLYNYFKEKEKKDKIKKQREAVTYIKLRDPKPTNKTPVELYEINDLEGRNIKVKLTTKGELTYEKNMTADNCYNGNFIYDTISQLFERRKLKTGVFLVKVEGTWTSGRKDVKSFVYRANNIKEFANSWRQGYTTDWWVNSEEFWTWRFLDGHDQIKGNVINVKISVSSYREIKANNIVQSFAKGKMQCFFVPLLNRANKHFENAKAKSTKNKWRDIITIIKARAKEYKEGIPEGAIQEISNVTQFNFVIYDILGGKYLPTIKTNKSRSHGTIEYINTDFNHVDEKLYFAEDTVKVTRQEMNKIQAGLNKYVYCGSKEEPFFILANNKKYKVINDVNDMIYKFEEEVGINKFKINMYKENDLCEYIRLGTHFTSHKVFDKYENNVIYGDYTPEKYKKLKNISEKDMKKSYTKYRDCPYYVKFPSIITNVRLLKVKKQDVFLKKYLGIFTLENLNFDNVKDEVKYYLREYGYMDVKFIELPNPDILFLKEHGVTFEITRGAFSSENFEFDYTEEMKESGAYKNHAGKLNQYSPHLTYRYEAEEKLGEALASNENYAVRYRKGEILVDKPNKNMMMGSHIAAFLTSYTRTTVLSHLVKMKPDDVIGVKLDCIVMKNYKDYAHIFSDNIWKPVKKNPNIAVTWTKRYFYPRNKFDKDIFGKVTYKFSSCVFLGSGGTGKTHYVCSDKGYRDILYVSFAWRLIVEKMKEYKINGTSLNSLLGTISKVDKQEEFLKKNKTILDLYKETKDDTYIIQLCQRLEMTPDEIFANMKKGFGKSEPYHIRNGYPGVILVDEITMMDKNDLIKIRKLYPYSQIIYSGDIDEKGNPFQCTIGDDNILNPSELKLTCYNFTIDYRAQKCPLLKELKQELRKITKMYYDDFDEFDKRYNCTLKTELSNLTFNFFRNNNLQKNIKVGDIKNMYTLKDDIISATNASCEKINNTIGEGKYRITSHSYDKLLKRKSGDTTCLLNGEITLEKPATKNYKLGHANTIHSFQGMTCKEKLFIDMRYIIDINQIYTAVSRATTIKNIYLII